SQPGTQSVNCAPVELIQKVAAHLADDAVAEPFLQHATECGRCGTLLREELQVLCGDSSEEERSEITALRTSNSQWQRDFAANLAATQRNANRSRNPFAGRTTQSWRLVVAFSAALVVCAVLGIWAWQNRTPDVTSLLARAYSESRTVELRFPDS